MTPNNILNMALLTGLDLIALTDHNSCQNCPALFAAAQGAPVTVIAGMELTTAEEVHVVCLFPSLPEAMAFDAYVYERLPKIKNRPDIFGEQLILDANDEVVGDIEHLLVSATSIEIAALPGLMRQFGGVCWPAHIDRQSYSVLSNLGAIPPECAFTSVEVAAPDAFFLQRENRCYLSQYHVLTNSDAHELGKIAEREHSIPLFDASYSALAGFLSRPVQ